jgi:D-psicose/D-tagatose/L-ribulose 3-epimerase
MNASFLSSRRDVLRSLAVTAAAAWPRSLRAGGLPFRYSICNEIFWNTSATREQSRSENPEFREGCKLARAMGYTGLEISPFTLANDVKDISAARRKELRDIMRSEGLQFVGLHWLLVTPDWLHITTPDVALRTRSWDYFRELIDLAGDLREGQSEPAIMVLGSPKQRGTANGATAPEAIDHLVDGLKSVADHAQQRECVICIETLDHSQTDVDNTLAETVQIVHRVNKPAVQTMFDFHNTPDETDPPEVLVDRYFPLIRHVHINEMDGRWPGSGHSDYVPLLRTLKRKNYRGWISLEVFPTNAGKRTDVLTVGAEKIGRASIDYLKALESKL